MNIRCAFCQTPYTLSRNEILFALQKIESEKLNHYDAHCPRCRRATQLPTQRLEMAMPNWRQAALDAASAPVAGAPAAPAQSEPVKPAVKIEPVSKVASQITTPIAKKIEAKTPVAKAKAAPKTTKPAVLKKTAAKKPETKAKPVAKKPADKKPVAKKPAKRK